MNFRPRSAIAELRPPAVQGSHATFLAYGLGLCEAFADVAWSASPDASRPTEQSTSMVPARRIVCREQDLHDVVPIICEGWAASVVLLSDGSRQILSFLLPGDIVSTALFLDVQSPCLIEAITDVRYRAFDRRKLKENLFGHPELLERLSKIWIEEKARSDQLAVDLGRRTADERIARLILNLAERMTQRGLAQSETAEMDFPLRQHHIADATGLTPVHVSKVLTEFRKNGLIDISDRSLTILDPAGFRRVALMR
jgi:CRP/FNR family transcriptional regulator, anaerobic regulatory protein